MRSVVVVFALSGCAGNAADRPLSITLGLPRTQADAALARHAYCHTVDGPRPDVETYPRCERTGTEWGESWVVATYAADRLVELRRNERFSDDTRAVERWNQLVAARRETTPATPEATATLPPLPPGTRSVQAFRIDAETIVGVYLLTPHPPDNISVVEAVLRVAPR